MTDDPDRELEAEALRTALGDFVIQFSQMVWAVETGTAGLLTRDRRRYQAAVAAVTAGKPTAQLSADRFFAVLTELPYAADWTDDDRGIVDSLRAEINGLIKQRNRIMHDAWFVGWGNEAHGISPPKRLRMATTPAKGAVADTSEVTVEDIDQLAEDARRLAALVRMLGAMAEARIYKPELSQPPAAAMHREPDGRIESRHRGP